MMEESIQIMLWNEEKILGGFRGLGRTFDHLRRGRYVSEHV